MKERPNQYKIFKNIINVPMSTCLSIISLFNAVIHQLIFGYISICQCHNISHKNLICYFAFIDFISSAIVNLKTPYISKTNQRNLVDSFIPASKSREKFMLTRKDICHHARHNQQLVRWNSL